MKKLIQVTLDRMAWMRASRTRWRDRRVATLGGLPFRSEPVKVTEYVPALHEEARVKLIEEYVTKLMPDAVDEATGHPLDNLINAMADIWLQEARRQHSRFRTEAARTLDEARAVSDQYTVLHSYDQRRLAEVEMALETVLGQVTDTYRGGDDE